MPLVCVDVTLASVLFMLKFVIVVKSASTLFVATGALAVAQNAIFNVSDAEVMFLFVDCFNK